MNVSPLLRIAILLAACAGSVAGQTVARPGTDLHVAPRPNVVLILADDLGNDLLAAYGEAPDPPCTPNLDALAAEGVLFRNAYTNPTCSATRAQVLTGRHGFRTGIGEPITPMTVDLPLGETVLPEVLPGYDTAAIGKWHLSNNASGSLHPNRSGFGHYAGNLRGALPDYFSWQKTVDGTTATTTTYATTDTADEAIAALQGMTGPWFLYVCFNAPHTPAHVPPASLCPCPTGDCATLGANPSVRDRIKASVEAMDTELGRLLDAVAAVDPKAYVIFLGDNGTAAQATEAPYSPAHAKGTVYEQGINVPLIVRGNGTVPYECDALVSSSDLFATLAELAGGTATAEDSISLTPYFRPGVPSLRRTVFAERFSPNGAGPYTLHDRGIRDARYKLIRTLGAPDEFYDLLSDPLEQTDLAPSLVPLTPEWDAYQDLVAELVALGVG